MVTSTLPITRLIDVSVNLTPSGAQTQNLSTLLILGSSDVIDMTERYRLYSDISSVAADFGTTAPEYLAAVLWFEQVPQPSQLLIGRWAFTATHGRLVGATLSATQQLLSNFTTVTNGEFTYAVDGNAPVTVGPINFSSVLNLPGVAAAITAVSTGVTFTWNSNYDRFEAQSNTTGAASSVSFLSVPGAGTDISAKLGMRSTNSGAYLAVGAAAETALSCVAFFDLNYGQTFYGITVLGAVDADHTAVGSFVNALTNKHIYFVSTQEAGVLVPAVTNDIASQLQDLGLLRTWVQYSSSNPYSAVSAAARILTTDFNGNSTVITLMYKQEPGIIPENLNENQVDALEAKNCNVFVAYNNDTAIIEQGKVSNGTFLDIVTGTDWLALTVQTSLYNLLYTSSTKIPQTDSGTLMLINVIEAVCEQGVINGLLSPGIWSASGFGILKYGDYLQKGYYVYAPKVSAQNPSDRAARKSVPLQVAAKLAGAVHTVDVIINVNQ